MKNKKPKIIIIDDDDDFREAITSILQDDGHEVVSLNSSKLVKDKLDSEQFDIALVDYFLPEENGIEIVKKFSLCKFGKNLTVIMISSHENIRKIVKDAGIKYFLPKPLDFDDLYETIGEIVS